MSLYHIYSISFQWLEESADAPQTQ